MGVRIKTVLFLIGVLGYVGLFLSPASALAVENCTAAEPRVSCTATSVYWRSYADYQSRLLSINFQFGSATIRALDFTVLRATNTDNVTLVSELPLALGDIDTDETIMATLKYRIPMGTMRFRTTIYITTRDDCGNSYFFPGPSSNTTTRYSITSRNSAQGQVTVNIDWDPAYDTDFDAVAAVRYRLYPAYPSNGGQPEYSTAGTVVHTSASDSKVISNLLPGRYYDFAVEVSDTDGVDGAQPQVETGKLLKDDRFVLTNILSNPHPGAFDEVRVRDYHNGGLYWYSAMSSWETGYGYEYVFSGGVNYEYGVVMGKAAWQRAVDSTNHVIYLAGEMPRPEGDHHYRAMIGVIYENSPGMTRYYLAPNTDDCNEYIGVALDTAGNRLLVGERSPGTPLRNSLWPDGGGLWSIPINTINQPNTYGRIYQDPWNRTWDKMVVFNGRLYATRHNGGYGVLYSAALADIPTSGLMPAGAWRTELGSSGAGVFSLLVSPYHGLVAAQERPGNYLTLNINDGSGWRTVESNYAPVGEGLYELSDHRFLVVRDNDGRSHHVGVASVNGEWEYLGTYAGGWPSYNYADDEANSIYYGTVNPGKVWKITYTP